jgi:hypothetical protein
MELFLNFLWVLIAVFALSVWRVCWAKDRSARRDPVQEWAAVICSLVFVFFAVSLSDDLHANLILFDESASGRRQSAVVASTHPLPHSGKTGAGISVGVLPCLASFHLACGVVDVALLQWASTTLLESDLHPGRAPPVSSL